MAQVSIVTAARREAAAEQAGAAAAAAVVVLNPGAREFLPWWRLGCAAVIVRKALSVDAPEFVMAASKGPAAADAGGGNDATPPGNIRTGRRGAYRPRKLSRFQEATKRTVFVKYIDHTITEQILAALFWSYGTVVDCRICGDPSNGLRFGFVEFQSEEEAYAALLLDGIIIGIIPLSVSPSRTAICPINPRFLPQSEAEWEVCSRTIYCTNISKIVQGSNLKAFCEAYFGKVCRLKLLDNDNRSTNLAFIEFAEVDGAIAALGSNGIFADGLRIRICPSKTPIRSYCYGRSPGLAGALAETNQAAPPELLPVNGGSTMVS